MSVHDSDELCGCGLSRALGALAISSDADVRFLERATELAKEIAVAEDPATALGYLIHIVLRELPVSCAVAVANRLGKVAGHAFCCGGWHLEDCETVWGRTS